MDHRAEWVVNGRGGCMLGRLHSLRKSLGAAFGYEAAGLHVFAICQQPGDEIIVFREQMDRVAASAEIMARQMLRRKDAQNDSLSTDA
jgi:hypothetical protein